MEAASESLSAYIDMARTYARMDYQGVYIYDIHEGRFLYTSDNPLIFCGRTEEEVRQNGLSWLARFIPRQELPMMYRIDTVVSSLYRQIPADLHSKVITYINFHILYDDRKVLVTHKLSILKMNDDVQPWLVLGLVAPSVHDRSGIIRARIAGTDYFYMYSVEDKIWLAEETVYLSQDERTMLQLSSQGFTMEQIAGIMFKSVDTVKFYRRRIFEKLDVKNISEAISYAINYGML